MSDKLVVINIKCDELQLKFQHSLSFDERYIKENWNLITDLVWKQLLQYKTEYDLKNKKGI